MSASAPKPGSPAGGAGRTTLLLALAFLLAPLPGASQDGLRALVEGADLLFDGRLRYEFVDQSGFAEEGHATTVRVRLGVETGEWRGVKLLVEGDATRHLGGERFNSTVNGRTGYPVVADPDSERLNRLHLSWRGPGGLGVVAGRQRLIHDDARFVGNVGFRQNEQTFDAVRTSLSPGRGITLEYGYVWQVNRIGGSGAAAGQVDSGSHLVRASHPVPTGTLTWHAYLVELEAPLAGASSRTFGARYAGEWPAGNSWRVNLAAAYHVQAGTGGTSEGFSLSRWSLEAGAATGGLRVAGNVESLEGDGVRGFGTPLATLHAFQGWADLFLVTPAGGVRDLNLTTEYRGPPVAGLGRLRFVGRAHHFRAGGGGPELGREVDLGIFSTPREGVTTGVEFAEFRGVEGGARIRKLWVSAGFAW